jgi:phosphatidylserine decarboxylase
MRNQNTPIAIEGFPFIIGAAVATVVLYTIANGTHSLLLYCIAAFTLALTLFIAYFFRNPHRSVLSADNEVIAPADGVVIFLGNAVEDHLDQEMTKISIFMSVFNVHINRVPLTGKLVDNYYVKGKFLDVRDERATFENERNGIVIETLQGLKIVVVQVAGLIARRIVCYPRVGEMVQKGQRYGLIRFGSRLDVYLPKGSAVAVKMGEKTVGGVTILGRLP